MLKLKKFKVCFINKCKQEREIQKIIYLIMTFFLQLNQRNLYEIISLNADLHSY